MNSRIAVVFSFSLYTTYCFTQHIFYIEFKTNMGYWKEIGKKNRDPDE